MECWYTNLMPTQFLVHKFDIQQAKAGAYLKPCETDGFFNALIRRLMREAYAEIFCSTCTQAREQP